MIDDELREFVDRLPDESFTSKPKGTKAFLPENVTEAGGDLDEVRAWVERNGGEEVIVQLDNSLLGRGLLPGQPRLVPYMWVPLGALRA